MRIFALIGFAIVFSVSANAQTDTPELDCVDGPVEKVFGQTDWLVYGCSDASSMVVVSDVKNPAAPFYFVLIKQKEGYRIYAEGNGDATASKAALDDLTALTSSQFEAMYAETLTASKVENAL